MQVNVVNHLRLRMRMFQILALSCTQAQPFRKLLLLPQVQLFFLINKIELKLSRSQTLFISDTGSSQILSVTLRRAL